MEVRESHKTWRYTFEGLCIESPLKGYRKGQICTICSPHHVNPLRKIDPLTACLIKVLSSCGVLDRKSLSSSSLSVPKASSDGTKMVHGPGSDIRTPRKEEEPNAARAFPNFL